VRVGDVVLDVAFTIADTAFRATVRRTGGRSPLTLRFEPALAPGARVQGVTAGGRAVPFRTASNGRAVLVSFDVPLGEGADIVVRHSTGWRLGLDGVPTERGERSRTLKVLDARVDDEGTFVVAFEGRAGARYEIGVVRPGGRSSREVVEFPAEGGDPRDGYVGRVVRFRP
jgi:hypothetical protein